MARPNTNLACLDPPDTAPNQIHCGWFHKVLEEVPFIYWISLGLVDSEIPFKPKKKKKQETFSWVLEISKESVYKCA